MSDYINNSQDVILKYARIVTAMGQPIDVKALIVEFNYFEDLFTNCVTGNVVINDSNDLLSAYSFSGNEYIVFSIDKPGLNQPIERVCRIYSVPKRKLVNDTNENYLLSFCSEEMILSEQYRVSKSYKNKKISDIVKDICNNYLQINSKKFGPASVEETKNVLDIVVPNMKPLEAINWLTTYAQSSKSGTQSSTYMFFENRDGYNFKSLQGLYSSPVYASYFYEPKNLSSDSDERSRDVPRDVRNAISYEIIDQFNSMHSASSGAFANKLLSIDVLSQTYNNTEFDYAKYFMNSSSMNDSGLLTNAKNRFGHMMNETPDGSLRVVTTLKNQSKNKYIASKNHIIRDFDVENFIPHRMAQLSHIMTIKLRLVVPGDILLKVGAIVNFNLPNVGIDDREKQINQLYSGKYLITALRHKIDNTGGFVTVLEISKESLPIPYAQFNNALAGFDDLRKH